MINKTKRQTLKILTTAGIGTATLSLGSMALATNILPTSSSMAVTALDEIIIQVNHSWTVDDLKVVIKNTSPTPTTITQLTPSKISTHLGSLDFDAAMASGPLRLAPGQEVNIHLDSSKVDDTPSVSTKPFLQALQKSIHDNVSVVTDHQTFAIVSTRFDPRIV